MLEQIKIFDDNRLAFEVIDEFNQTDEKAFQKFFTEKLKQGHEKINVLIKLDELKLTNIKLKAFAEQAVWLLRHQKNMGHLAIVGNSGLLEKWIPIDNLFYKREKEGRLEKYFDVADIDKAFEFIVPR